MKKNEKKGKNQNKRKEDDENQEGKKVRSRKKVKRSTAFAPYERKQMRHVESWIASDATKADRAHCVFELRLWHPCI